MQENASPSSRLPLLILCAILLAGIPPQLFWITRARDDLVTQTLYADAFYYFQTARSVAEGRGSTSSGGIAHNGYHPLWMLVCAASFRLFENDLTAIRAVLSLGAILSILSALAIYGILLSLGCSRWVGIFAAACFYLNPWMMSLAICGLEAPLNALLLALTVWVGVSMARRPLSWRFFAVFGLLAGLVYLVRTDNAFFLAATFAMLALRGGKLRLKHLAAAAGIAFLLILPWHVWNYHRFGTFLQGSASALPFVREVAFFDAHPGASAGDLARHRANLFAGWFPGMLYYSGLGSAWYVFFGAVFASFLRRRAREEAVRLGLALLELASLAAGVAALGFAHKYARLASREWYYAGSDVFLALLLGVIAHYLLRVASFSAKPSPRTARILVWTMLLGPACFFLGTKTVSDWAGLGGRAGRLDRPRGFALEILDAFEKLEGLAPDEVFGATDSDTVGFFCSRPVVNLDGVVNPEAARAIRAGALVDYVEQKGIRYLTITPRMQSARILGKDWRWRLALCPNLTAEGFMRVEDGEKPGPTGQESK